MYGETAALHVGFQGPGWMMKSDKDTGYVYTLVDFCRCVGARALLWEGGGWGRMEERGLVCVRTVHRCPQTQTGPQLSLTRATSPTAAPALPPLPASPGRVRLAFCGATLPLLLLLLLRLVTTIYITIKEVVPS